MRPRTALAAVICIVVAALAGYFVAGKYIAKASIGLDPSAFPLGELVQSIGVALFPNLEIAVGGRVLALGTVLLVPIVVFVVVRRTARMPVGGGRTRAAAGSPWRARVRPWELS
jgi:hypothetical protein